MDIPAYVWVPEYCGCTLEGGFVALAVCQTRAKARLILSTHKREIMRPWVQAGEMYRRRSWEVWRVRKLEVV